MTKATFGWAILEANTRIAIEIDIMLSDGVLSSELGNDEGYELLNAYIRELVEAQISLITQPGIDVLKRSIYGYLQLQAAREVARQRRTRALRQAIDNNDHDTITKLQGELENA